MDTFKSQIIIKKQSLSNSESMASIPPKGSQVSFSDQLPTLKQIEQMLIDEAMKRSSGNQSIAALSLGISRQALNKRLKKSQQQNHDST